MLNKFLILFSIVIVLSSCGQKKMSPKNYIEWIEDGDNNLSIEKEFDDISYQLLYKPIDFIVAKEFINGAIKKDSVSKRISELGDMQYFTLRIRSLKENELLKAGIKTEDEYYQRLEYFMSSMQDDIYLIEDQDTIPCALNHFERNYGLAPYNNFVIAFTATKNKLADKVFVYDDKIFGTGKIMMKIQSDDINNIPLINWK